MGGEQRKINNSIKNKEKAPWKIKKKKKKDECLWQPFLSTPDHVGRLSHVSSSAISRHATYVHLVEDIFAVGHPEESNFCHSHVISWHLQTRTFKETDTGQPRLCLISLPGATVSSCVEELSVDTEHKLTLDFNSQFYSLLLSLV